MACVLLTFASLKVFLLPLAGVTVMPLLYPDVGPEDRLRLELVNKVLVLTSVFILVSSYKVTQIVLGPLFLLQRS